MTDLTDMCKNITLPQTSFAGGKNCPGNHRFMFSNTAFTNSETNTSKMGTALNGIGVGLGSVKPVLKVESVGINLSRFSEQGT